ncbi:MAG: threonine synthase [Sphaerochaetaceae bacterium]
MQYKCVDCQRTYPITDNRFRCGCGGMLNLEYEKKRIDFSRTRLSSDHSLWKYLDALPVLAPQSWKELTLGEGGTPLVKVGPSVWGKADYYMPTLSFKDRGAVVLVSMMKDLGVTQAVADSSGNAGTAIAAYCARAGIGCDVFVPASTSTKKIEQIVAHGAIIHAIEGSREDTARAAIQMVEQTGRFYASHIYNPLFWEGTKTYLYEIFEQTQGMLPQLLFVPVGNGTLLMGVSIALTELQDWGYIGRMPRLIAVQAENCSPLAKAFFQGEADYLPYATTATQAEGIASAQPARGKEILKAVRANGGSFVTVTESQILTARAALAAQGIYVEITSAANYAGYLAYMEKHPEDASLSAIFPLCGAGLKSAH